MLEVPFSQPNQRCTGIFPSESLSVSMWGGQFALWPNTYTIRVVSGLEPKEGDDEDAEDEDADDADDADAVPGVPELADEAARVIWSLVGVAGGLAA